MLLRHRNGQVLVSLVVKFFLRYEYCFSYKKKPRLKLNLTEAELVVALHYVARSRTPTALNLSASTEKSKG